MSEAASAVAPAHWLRRFWVRGVLGLCAGLVGSMPDGRPVFAEVEAGVLYANRTAGATTGAVVGVQPFGGWKMSGSSGKSAGGHHYLPQFLREQSQTEYEA